MKTYPKNKDLFRLIVISLTEIFWYKPLTLIWRMEGFIYFLLGRQKWGEMKRQGLSEKGSVE